MQFHVKDANKSKRDINVLNKYSEMLQPAGDSSLKSAAQTTAQGLFLAIGTT